MFKYSLYSFDLNIEYVTCICSCTVKIKYIILKRDLINVIQHEVFIL